MSRLTIALALCALSMATAGPVLQVTDKSFQKDVIEPAHKKVNSPGRL